MKTRALSLKIGLFVTCAAMAPAFGQVLSVPIPNQPDPLLQSLSIPNNAAVEGMWSASQSWPLVSIHATLLPDGSVLTFGSPVGQGAQDGRTFVRWNPWTGTLTTTPNSQNVNSFCSAAVLQPQTGGLLVSGGNEALQSTVFDYLTGVPTTEASQLASDRWYGTMTMLADGRTLMTGGSFPYAINVWQNPGSQQSLNDISMTPEVYTPGSGWSSLFGANSREAFGPDYNRWWYPRQWVAPDGMVFGISSEKWWRLNPSGTGSIIAFGDFKTPQNNTTRPNIGPTSTAVMYDVGKVLQVGGNGYTNEQSTVSSERATVFDINGGNPVFSDVPSMQYRRQWVNSVVVPTGQVVITGGTQHNDRGDPDAVYQAELWDPNTQNFSPLASASIIRNYHSTTVLLENGAIFSSGGGVPGPVTNFNYEIFYPPYLFQAQTGADTLADRPVLVSIDDTRFGYGSSFQVELGDTRTISRVAMIGLSTTTHSFNMGQRYYPASFSQAGNMLTVVAPPSPNLAPPGFYLLHAVDSAGVPSRGFIFSVGEAACDADIDCDDGNVCTIDVCNGGLCSNTNTCTDPLALYYFDGGPEDDSGNGNDAALGGGASIVPGHVGDAVDIDAGAEFVDLPDGIVQPCDDFTFAAWVELDANGVWSRIFDFGTDPAANMFLTPAAGNVDTLRFAIKVAGGAEEQLSFPYTFPVGVWTHVAVVLQGDVGTLYVDGAPVITGAIVANPSGMGATVNNWFGQSQYAADPNLDGRIDEVEMSCRAYSAQEIADLANLVECQAGPDCDDGDPCTADICTGGTCSNPENGSCSADDPVAYYPMDDAGGTSAADLGGNANDGTLLNGASFSTAGVIGGAVDINAGTQYVDLPDGLVSQCTDFTFASWVWLDTNADWNRIFDFGTDTLSNMFLTPKVGGANTLRFALKVPGINGGAEEQISFPFTFPLGTWTHVAVVLAGSQGTLFVDGAPVATAPITGNPADMGSTINNWLGQSQWPDPHFDGKLDEVWISCRAYTNQEISNLATLGPACGDNTCDAGEDCASCAADCGTCPPVCNNGTCEAGEDCGSCPADCGTCPPVCNNGTCEAGETCGSCPSDCGQCPSGEVLIDAGFASGVEGFGYADDTFRSTAAPAYASGSLVAGALQVQLGAVNDDDIFGMSGGWGRAFEMAAAGPVDISIGYSVQAAAAYEDNECSQVLVSVDGVLYGAAPNDYVVELCSGGGQSGVFTTTTQDLAIGSHSVTIGAYNNAKTELAEITTVQIDQVQVVTVTPECSVDADCDDFDPCTANVCNAGSCSFSDDGSCTDPLALYAFEDGVGTTALDETGNGHHATLLGGASFVSGRVGGGVDINGGTQAVDLPDALLTPCNDLTIATWVRLDANADWNRIFDFGNDAATNMFLTPKVGGTDTLRFAFKAPAINGGAEEQLSYPFVFPLDTWTHVAVVLQGDTGTLYVDGSPVVSGAIIGNPSDLGGTVNNWLGDSQYAADPTFDGSLDEFEISCRAYSDLEILELALGESCNDGSQNQDETGIDCGGSICAACPTCSDGSQNQDETGIDCGGSICPACPTCSDGLCNGSEDCSSCAADCGVCPTCSDGVQNQDETDIDCGGSICPACPTCSDGIQNQDETDIDCGGTVCPACPACGDGLCNGSEDCSSCAADCGVCPTCSDGVQNQDETDIDCGGSICPACPTCSDGILNQDETDIDCGGTVCPACPSCGDGLCNGSEDCASCATDCGACPTCSDGILNQDETDIDCGGTVCPACPSCSDGILNQDETDVDCGGSICPTCPSCGDGLCNGTETCDSCSVDCGACGPLVDANFNTGADGFSYSDDTFRGTNQPGYASGALTSGAAQVTLGGINDDDIVNMSGGWGTSFGLAQPGAVEINVAYSMTAAAAYEDPECSQVLVSIDGVLYGAGGNDYVAQICSGGGQSGVFTTTTAALSAGSHSITVGAFNNAKTELAEVTMVQFDQVTVTEAPPECATNADCDDADPCTADLCSAGVCSNPDSGICVADDSVAFYPMDDGSGIAAADISGNANDATLQNGASFTTAGLLGGAVDINAGTQFVDLPDGLVSACDDFTFASWVWLDTNADWNRIFDFGNSTATNMFLTPKVGGANTLRFALKVPGINGGAEEQISFPFTFPLSTWTHVAVVLAGNTGTLFVDGAAVASASVTGNPQDMGNTLNNWLGRSQWPDPYFNGRLDEVRIACRAYTGQEIADLADPSAQAFSRRSLFETTGAAVNQFSLEETLDALGSNAGLTANGLALYQELIDSYATAPGSIASAVHCGDENPGGQPTLNGYPIDCDRLEAQQLDNLGGWFATAVVNRIDLAPQDGSHCGNQRLIFANNAALGNGRMSLIIEAQLPNPSPAAGVAGCLPIAEFWSSLDSVTDPVQRGLLLRAAFLTTGVVGIGPFMNAAHLTAGTGQIRTNNFNDTKWTMREFKLVQNGAQAQVVPFPVDASPYGPLWNDSLPLAQGPACRQSFLDAIPGLLSDNPAELALVVAPECENAESLNDFTAENYPLHMLAGDAQGFQADLAQALGGTGLTPLDIAARARFAGSCIGCHQEAKGSSLGNGVQAPSSLGFVHVAETFMEQCEDGPCFPISQALRDVFLPHRGQVMSDLLASAGAAANSSGASLAPTLASANLSVEDLVLADAAADANGNTLGGQPANVSH